MKDLGYYKLIRNKVKSGDMLEFRSNGFTGRAIRFFSKQNVNHTALAVALDEYMDLTHSKSYQMAADKCDLTFAEPIIIKRKDGNQNLHVIFSTHR